MSMISINSIDKKIKATEEQINEIEKMGSNVSPLMQLTKVETQRRLENLIKDKEKLIEASNKDNISLRIYGESVEKGRISNRILISVLSGFQTMTESIANTIVGSKASNGKISDLAKNLTDFEVAGTFAGSFGIVMEKMHNQLEIDSNVSRTNQILSEFYNILENSRSGSNLIETIAPYGKRTVMHYREWLSKMKDNSVNVEIDWIDNSAEIHKIDFKYFKVDDIISTLDSIGDIEEESLEVKGILTGLNIRQSTFEINSEEYGILKGKSTIEVLLSISEKIGQEINASMMKNTSCLNDNVMKITWYLSSII